MKKPISIIVPSYKKNQLLKKTLTSLTKQVKQSSYNDEILVIDDGLYDFEVIDQFDVYHLIRPHKHQYQLASNNNYGLRISSNPYIAKIDADCIPLKGWLDDIRAEIHNNTLCLGRIRWGKKGEGVRQDSRFDDSYKYANDLDNAPQQAWGGNIAATKSDLFELGGWTEQYDGNWGSEESDLGWKFYYSGKDIKFCYDPVVFHQYHDDRDYRTTSGQNKNYDLLEEKKEQYKEQKSGLGKIIKC